METTTGWPKLEFTLNNNSSYYEREYSIGFGGHAGDYYYSGISLRKSFQNSWEILIFQRMTANAIERINREPSETLIDLIKYHKNNPDFIVYEKLIEDFPEILQVL